MAEWEKDIAEALELVERFVEETTGEKPTPEEIARALRRYFVLNEIKDHILIDREAVE